MNTTNAEQPDLPDRDDICRAADSLPPMVLRTPLLEHELLNRRLGARIFFKPECLQCTGSFKIRGAYTKIARLPAQVRKRGVVAFSSGNHAQGVALAARMFDIRCTIVMPDDAPKVKVAHTREYGAHIVFYDRESQDRKKIAGDLAKASGATLVPPFDDPDIIAGQGTVGLELAEQARALKISVDAVLCPCGGGGLVAGCALALEVEERNTKVYAVEPLGFDDTRRSLVAGERVANAPGPKAICDAIMTEAPGVLTFEINRRLLAGALIVSDAQVMSAMRDVFELLKLVVEPSGAVGLAAVITRPQDFRDKNVVVVLSGGNVDSAAFASILTGQSPTA